MAIVRPVNCPGALYLIRSACTTAAFAKPCRRALALLFRDHDYGAIKRAYSASTRAKAIG